MYDLSFSIWCVPGTEQIVEQIHCQNWPDPQPPKDTSVLLDTYRMVEAGLLESPGTLLVHCSAGVGRSGAFIGLYKMINDIENSVSWILFLLVKDNIDFLRLLLLTPSPQ